jgi:Ca-activated chloride channel family protein
MAARAGDQVSGAVRAARRRTLPAAVVVFLSATAMAGIVAQTPFRAGVELVRVDVSVTRGGQPVRGLTAADFSISDSGVAQRVDSVTLLDELPLSVQMVLDTSGSVAGDRLKHLVEAGQGLLAALESDDRVGLMTFSQRIEVNVPAAADHGRVAAALPALAGRGPTAVRDAIWMALQLRPADETRPLVLVFSDGVDTASWLTRSALLEAVRRAGVVVHAVELVEPVLPTRRGLPAASFLSTVAEAAGGRAWSATSSRELRELFTRALAEMRARYLVTFYPEGTRRAGWHELKIGVKGRGEVKARPGYFVARGE